MADLLRDSLPRTRFWTGAILEDVRLDEAHEQTRLLVTIRTEQAPAATHALVTVLDQWDFEAAGLGPATPNGWSQWLLDAVVEAVDAAPGLPTGPIADDGLVWVDLDR